MKGGYQVLEVKEAYLQAWKELVAETGTDLDIRISALERHGDALCLKPSVPASKLAEKAGREIAYLRYSDLSAHAVLSLADAKQVVAEGWGENYGLSGSVVPLGYTMLHST